MAASSLQKALERGVLTPFSSLASANLPEPQLMNDLHSRSRTSQVCNSLCLCSDAEAPSRSRRLDLAARIAGVDLLAVRREPTEASSQVITTSRLASEPTCTEWVGAVGVRALLLHRRLPSAAGESCLGRT